MGPFGSVANVNVQRIYTFKIERSHVYVRDEVDEHRPGRHFVGPNNVPKAMNAKERRTPTVGPTVDGDMKGPVVGLEVASEPLLVYLVNLCEVAGDRSPRWEGILHLRVGASEHLLELNVQNFKRLVVNKLKRPNIF